MVGKASSLCTLLKLPRENALHPQLHPQLCHWLGSLDGNHFVEAGLFFTVLRAVHFSTHVYIRLDKILRQRHKTATKAIECRAVFRRNVACFVVTPETTTHTHRNSCSTYQYTQYISHVKHRHHHLCCRSSYHRTIAKALRVTKFDSVSTLLADYTNRNTASSTAPSGNPKITTPRAVGGRAATAAPDGGSKTRKTRARRSNTIGEAGLSEAPAVVDPKAPYPTGKLEEDKNESLFASSMGGGGRKMVSVMTKHAVKGGRDSRRAKTAGVGEGERGGTLKGLAIRDLPPPGFVPPAETDPAAAGTRALTNDPTGRADNGQKSANGDGTGERCRIGNQMRDMSGPEETKAVLNGASVGKTEQHAVKEICFNCWSKGSGKSCTLHRGRSEAVAGEGGGGKPGDTRPAESALMCKNWDVGVMRRRYRSEELQVWQTCGACARFCLSL